MAKRRVIIELKSTKPLREMAFDVQEIGVGPKALPKVEGVEWDLGFSPVPLPRTAERDVTDPMDAGPRLELLTDPGESTYVVRAEVEESQIEQLQAHAAVVGVFSDPVIEPCLVCPGHAPVGTDADVERLLCVQQMRRFGMDGTGVMVAIVDTGINMAHLNSHGKTPTLDTARSWVPQPGLVPGDLPVGHGTMCAYDVCIAAPDCTLLDIALLQSTATGPMPMSGVLSDALPAYRHLIDIMLAPVRPGEGRSLVVNNSWGMFHPSWDFPVGHPGNYSDNPRHPFNLIVADLELAGADILFAAGNCGRDCADGRCRGVVDNAIYGANGHGSVLCVAGVDVNKSRVGYSTIGPGRLTREKPDVCGYTHFRGSGVYPADGGTSAATPVVAGVVAALRSRRPQNANNPATRPAAIRSLVRSTAEDLGAGGFDFEHGFGIVDGCALFRTLMPRLPREDVCARYPWLCGQKFDICKLFPVLCKARPRPGAVETPDQQLVDSPDLEDLDPLELSYVLGWMHGESAVASARGPAETGMGAKPCSC